MKLTTLFGRIFSLATTAFLATGCLPNGQIPSVGFRIGDNLSNLYGMQMNWDRLRPDSETPEVAGLWVLAANTRLVVVTRAEDGTLTNEELQIPQRVWINLGSPDQIASALNHGNPLPQLFGVSFPPEWRVRGVEFEISRVLVTDDDGQLRCDGPLSVPIRISGQRNFSTDGALQPRNTDPSATYRVNGDGTCSLGV